MALCAVQDATRLLYLQLPNTVHRDRPRLPLALLLDHDRVRRHHRLPGRRVNVLGQRGNDFSFAIGLTDEDLPAIPVCDRDLGARYGLHR